MNITFAIDDDLIAAAKVQAARSGTSVNALVRHALEQIVYQGESSSGRHGSGILETLVQFSLGKTPRLAAMQQLGLQDYSQLLLLLNAAGIPHPLVPLSERTKMAEAMVQTINAQVSKSAKP